MRFGDVSIGESVAISDGGSPAWRVILRKTEPLAGVDDCGRRLEIFPDQEVELLGGVTVHEASWVTEGADSWRFQVSWRSNKLGSRLQSSSFAPGELGVTNGLREKEGHLGAIRRARSLLASSFLARGEARRAIQIYDELLAEREEASLLNNRGAARNAMGDVVGALRDYDQAVEIDPGLAQAFSNRGNALTKLGRYEEAIDDYNHAVELAENLAPIYCNRGLTRRLQGNFRASLEDLDLALAVDGEFAPAYLARGGVRTLTGDTPGAIEDLQRYLQLKPDAVEAEQVRQAIVRLGSEEGSIER